jgi:small GTP-binding protein
MLPIVALVGRPNVGKSTLFNTLTGTRDAIVADVPGVTRDRQYGYGRAGDVPCVVVDTGGVVVSPRSGVEQQMRVQTERAIAEADRLILVVDGRTGLTSEDQEVARLLRRAGKPVVLAVNKAEGRDAGVIAAEFHRLGFGEVQAIAAAHVVVLVLDAHAGVAEQDASVLGLALQKGRALLLAINKWDGIPMDKRDAVRNDLALRLDFVPFAPQHFISARHGTGVGELAAAAVRAYEASMREMKTPQLSKVLEKAMEAHQPPLVKGRRIKLRYAHQGGRNPPRIVIHGNQTQETPDAYRRYLANVFREAFDLYACPVVLELRTDANPFGNREQREAAERKLTAKKKAGQKNVARRVSRKKVAAGKSTRRPRR